MSSKGTECGALLDIWAVSPPIAVQYNDRQVGPAALSAGSNALLCTKLALVFSRRLGKSVICIVIRLAHLLLAVLMEGIPMTARPTPAPGPTDGTTPPRSVSRADVIDAAARVITRR